MRQLAVAGAAVLVFCGPVRAFDFTPRSFGTFYDARLRSSGLRYMDHCSDVKTKGYSCDYGVYDRDPNVYVTNLGAESDRANALVVHWTPVLSFKTHVNEMVSVIEACAPETSNQERITLIGRILDQGLRQTSHGLANGILFKGVRYSLMIDPDGSAQIHVNDLRMPARDGVDDAWGSTEEMKQP